MQRVWTQEKPDELSLLAERKLVPPMQDAHSPKPQQRLLLEYGTMVQQVPQTRSQKQQQEMPILREANSKENYASLTYLFFIYWFK
jgi:hypothetical protein